MATVARKTDDEYALLDATEVDFERVAVKVSHIPAQAILFDICG